MAPGPEPVMAAFSLPVSSYVPYLFLSPSNFKASGISQLQAPKKRRLMRKAGPSRQTSKREDFVTRDLLRSCAMPLYEENLAMGIGPWTTCPRLIRAGS
jgi:hypothetical protein